MCLCVADSMCPYMFHIGFQLLPKHSMSDSLVSCCRFSLVGGGYCQIYVGNCTVVPSVCPSPGPLDCHCCVIVLPESIRLTALNMEVVGWCLRKSYFTNHQPEVLIHKLSRNKTLPCIKALYQCPVSIPCIFLSFYQVLCQLTASCGCHGDHSLCLFQKYFFYFILVNLVNCGIFKSCL